MSHPVTLFFCFCPAINASKSNNPRGMVRTCRAMAEWHGRPVNSPDISQARFPAIFSSGP